MNIIITGATSGIGRASATLLAQDKRVRNLWITGRRTAQLNDLAQELQAMSHATIHAVAFDVRNRERVVEFVENLKQHNYNIDVLINNAGLALGTESIHDGNIDDWETMIDTNIKGMLYMTKYISAMMIQAAQGHIINIGSTAGKVMYEKGNVYCATKSAVDALGQTMRIDLLPYNIKVTNINPGMVETEFSIVRMKGDTDQAKKVYDGFAVLRPEDVADAIQYCLSLPPHVCINDLTITCTQQANSVYKYKKV